MPDVTKIRIKIVNSFIKKKSSAVIFSITIFKSLNFIKKTEKLIVIFNRVKNVLIILNDYNTIKQRKNYNNYNTIIRYYQNINTFCTFEKLLKPLNDSAIKKKLYRIFRKLKNLKNDTAITAPAVNDTAVNATTTVDTPIIDTPAVNIPTTVENTVETPTTIDIPAVDNLLSTTAKNFKKNGNRKKKNGN